MNSSKRVPAFLCGVASVALVALAGIAPAQAQSSTSESSTQSQDRAGDYVADALITTRVKAAFFEDSLVRATEVKVETFRGTVQLSGFVSSEAAVQQAVRVARDVKGVLAVRNDMRVK